MDKKTSNQYVTSESLDENGDCEAILRFSVNPRTGELESFAVILRLHFKNRAYEVVRFDGSLIESPNVHRFYLSKKQKKFLGEPLSWETAEKAFLDIKKKWQWYRSQFTEQKGL